MMRFSHVLPLVLLASIAVVGRAQELRTSLENPDAKFRRPKEHFVVLKRGDVEAVVVDNEAVDVPQLPGHRAGYSGVAALRHARRKENLFVPAYAGLNFEHIHDGTKQPRDILFEPRRAAMELRVIDEHTVELYQPPTPTWKLESTTRYRLLEDGTIEMSFECIPRAKTFTNGYIGLFWASYIHQPESLDIHFRGAGDGDETVRWIRGVTPAHGTLPTHLAESDSRRFEHAADFPLSLVFNRSKYRYHKPWYFGVSHGLALVYVFDARDQIRFSQSPSGGGQGNPAWDFQYLIPDYQVGRRYGFTMRTLYLPYQSPEQIQRAVAGPLQALNSNHAADKQD